MDNRAGKYVVYENLCCEPRFRGMMNISRVGNGDLENVKIIGCYRTMFFANWAFHESLRVPIQFVIHDIGFFFWTLYRRLSRCDQSTIVKTSNQK